jgi:hypothetical protein
MKAFVKYAVGRRRCKLRRLTDLQVARGITGALHAGQRIILVPGRDPHSSHVPEAALASASASVRILHIRPPLPEPAEMQEMIGEAVEIAGGREMAPLSMALRLLLLNRGRSVILAIDDADTLSYRSLLYLTEMTELLAPDAPVLQIVLAAKPALLDTLAQPEFERFRNRLCRPEFETFQPSREAEADGVQSSRSRLASAALAPAPDADPMAASPRIARPATRRVVGIGAIVGVAATGFCYFAFDFDFKPTLPTIPSPIAASLQNFPAASEFPQLLGRLVAPVDLAAVARVDEELDYRITQGAKSLERWRAFLVAHGGGLYADNAKAEINKLLAAQNTEAKPLAEGAPDVPLAEAPKSGSVAPRNTEPPHVNYPSEEMQVASVDLEDSGQDGARLLKLSDSCADDQAAGSASERGCEVSRPEALRLVERSEPASAPLTVVEVSKIAREKTADEAPDSLSVAAQEAEAETLRHDETAPHSLSDLLPEPTAASPSPLVKAHSLQKRRAVLLSNKAPSVDEFSRSHQKSRGASHCSRSACYRRYALPLILMALLGEKPRRSGSFDGIRVTHNTTTAVSSR